MGQQIGKRIAHSRAHKHSHALHVLLHIAKSFCAGMQCSSLCQITRFRSMQRQTWDASGSIWSPALIDVCSRHHSVQPIQCCILSRPRGTVGFLYLLSMMLVHGFLNSRHCECQSELLKYLKLVWFWVICGCARRGSLGCVDGISDLRCSYI
jgi:hypothetical protein